MKWIEATALIKDPQLHSSACRQLEPFFPYWQIVWHFSDINWFCFEVTVILLRPGKESSWGFFQFCNILLFYQCFIGINLLKAKIFHCYLTALWGWDGKEKGSACRQSSRIEPWIEHKGRFQAPQLCFCSCSWDFNTWTRLTLCSLSEYIHTSSSWTKHIEGRQMK